MSMDDGMESLQLQEERATRKHHDLFDMILTLQI